MRFVVRAGTPGEMDEKTYTKASDAKKHLRTRINKYQIWAARYNHDLAQRLISLREQVDSLDLVTLPVSEIRRWSERDDHTMVEFTFEVRKEYG